MRAGIAWLCLSLTACGSCASPDLTEQMRCNWTQWGRSSTHQGSSCATAQPPDRLLARVAYDPLSDVEAADTPGDEGPSLLVHYAVPLVVDDDVYLVVKGGPYVPCEPVGSFMLADGGELCGLAARSSLHWSVKAFHWSGDALEERWTYDSDWKPVPFDLVDWEPPLQPAVAGDFVWVPGASGTLDQLDRATGQRRARIDVLHDPRFFAVSGVTASTRGELYYTVLALDPADAFKLLDARLVKVDSDGRGTSLKWSELVPAPAQVCHGQFRQPPDRAPFPPLDDAGVPRPPPDVPCGPQRPGVIALPALSADGSTVYVVSRDHFNSRYAYLAAVTRELRPKWSASLRDRLDDGCGVLNPATAQDNPDGGRGTTSTCRAGAATGVDPATNERPAGRVNDSSSSSPMVLPDGTVLYGAFTSYNRARGHLMHFSAEGTYLGAYDFGWDITPAAYAHDGTYSVVVKENNYFQFDGGEGPFLLTSLDAELKARWSFQNTETMSCHDDGGCTDDHPDGFEWCIDMPAVDAEGSVLGNAEDGYLYVLDAAGKLKARKFLKLALSAAYTPVALDAKGRIYAMNGGELFVFGR